MTKFNGTPGPWFVGSCGSVDGIHGYHVNIKASDGYHISRISFRSIDETEANARLIAAAPDLLNRLQIALDMLETFEGTGKTCRVIRKTITKALG